MRKQTTPPQSLWMPVWYDAGREVEGGLWRSCTYYGTALADKNEAWTEARRMCDECGGIGFTVSRVAPVSSEATDASDRCESRCICGAEQSSRGDA